MITYTKENIFVQLSNIDVYMHVQRFVEPVIL